eukprot:3222330-Rhodomonas_salina.1
MSGTDIGHVLSLAADSRVCSPPGFPRNQSHFRAASVHFRPSNAFSVFDFAVALPSHPPRLFQSHGFSVSGISVTRALCV